jgi:hypothetical protein
VATPPPNSPCERLVTYPGEILPYSKISEEENFIFRDRNRLESLNLKCFRQDMYNFRIWG